MYSDDRDREHDCCPNCTNFVKCSRCRKDQSPPPILYGRLGKEEVERLTNELEIFLRADIGRRGRR